MTVAATKDLRRAGFPFRSGRLCLDFVATVAKRGMGDRELLTGPAALRTWLHVAELPAARGSVTEADLRRVRELREAIHTLTRRHVDGLTPDPAAIEIINAAALSAAPPALLGSDAHTLLPPADAPLEGILAMLARDTIDLFGGPLQHRIRACIGHDCSLFFVDRSRPGNRRWCTMAACGEKASSATYRKRHPANRKA
ncbi:CGNR zinc finger domain-containing protein [Amycolatopsis acidicola]|nr:ABATE domain-containing protein [Amycolatopsis acidicola]